MHFAREGSIDQLRSACVQSILEFALSDIHAKVIDRSVEVGRHECIDVIFVEEQLQEGVAPHRLLIVSSL